MSNEKQIDAEHWKNKLDNLTSLPGEESIINKTAAWEKLHDRLHEKPRRNKMAWYWVAAACLLLALLIPWILLNKKENGLVKNTTQQKQNKIVHAPIPFIRKEQVAVSSSVSIEKNQRIKNIFDKRNLNNSNTTTKKDNTKKDDAFIANTKKVIDKTPEQVINTAPFADTITAVKTIAIVKPTLRVVHINELETASPANPEQVAISIHHEQNNFKFRFRNIHPVNQPAAPRQEYATLKIPLTN